MPYIDLSFIMGYFPGVRNSQ